VNTLGVQAVLPVKPPTLEQGMKAHGKNWHGTDVQRSCEWQQCGMDAEASVDAVCSFHGD